MDEIQISDKISYIEQMDNPLSADIGVVRNNGIVWLYDVGNGTTSLGLIPGDVSRIVLSHFHQDHIGNVETLVSKHLCNDEYTDIEQIYLSKQTSKYTDRGIIIDEDLCMDNIRIFTLPSSHARGSLGLEVDGEYAFVGDALYPQTKNGKRLYNAQLLKEEIEVLKKLDAHLLLVSHADGLVRYKDEEIYKLEEVFRRRTTDSPFIYV